MPKQEQIDEWFENDVTRHFLKIIQAKLDHVYAMRADVFFPGEPNKTQESKATLLGAEGELGDLIQAFEEKDLSQLEDQIDESIRHSPGIRSSTN